jgi:DnaJ like chaperone protein
MTIWGKILGGAAGFAVGGPLGMIIGAAAGHAVDRMYKEKPGEGGPDEGARPDGTKQIAFTIGVIVLGAKMAKADGRVTRDEIRAFKQIFHVPPEEEKNVGRIFNQARRDAQGFEPYARQLAKLFQHEPAVLEKLLSGLFHIARADGHVAESELAYLKSISDIFGFDARTWESIRAGNMGNGKEDPYHILGVEASASDAEIKAVHRKLVLENHPDRLIAQGVPEEFVDLADDRLAAINAAYDEIRERRGLS